VSNYEDQPLNIYTKKVVASNGLVHSAMLATLNS
jgi:hypothetical protein